MQGTSRQSKRQKVALPVDEDEEGDDCAQSGDNSNCAEGVSMDVVINIFCQNVTSL